MLDPKVGNPGLIIWQNLEGIPHSDGFGSAIYGLGLNLENFP